MIIPPSSNPLAFVFVGNAETKSGRKHKSVNWVDQFWEKAQVVADWSADAEKTVKEAKSDAPGQAVGGRAGPRIGGN